MSIVPIHPDDLEPAEGDPTTERAQDGGVARRTATRRTLGRKIPPSRRTLGRKPAPSRRTLMPRVKI